MLFDVGLCVVTLGLIIYLWLTWNYNYWKNVGVKYISPSLIFGNLKDVLLNRRNTAFVYNDLYWSHPQEPAVGVFRLRQPELVIRDYDLVKTVLVKEFSNFHDNPMTVDKKVDPILGNNPFVAKGDSWKALRSIHTPAFTTIKLKGMLPLMQDVCKDMVQFLKQTGETPLEAKYFAGQFTTDVVASCVYGVSSNSFKDPNATFRKMSYKVFEPTFKVNLVFLLIQYFPSLVGLFNLRIMTQDVVDFFKDVISETRDFRKRNGIKRNDFLQQLLNENEKGEKIVHSDDEILGYTMTFFFDGYETSSILISQLIYQIAVHGEVQHKLREEIKSAFNDLENIDFDVLQGLPYLDAVICETLRLYPPGTVLNKLCTRDTVLRCEGREYPMRSGMTVSLPIYSLHRDPKYFSDPEEFMPERFYKKTDTTEGFFPFGLGPRACLGTRFALTQTKVALVTLVSNFQISTKEANPGPLEFDASSTIFMLPKGGLWVKFKSLQKT